MSLETFRKSVDLLTNFDSSITIGGGEPTIHPLFWQFLCESIASSDCVWLATNGSQTNISLALAKMAEKGVIGCALSQDKFHDPIDPKVVQAFTKTTNRDTSYNSDRSIPDGREIRNVERMLIKAGRSKTGTNDCICSDIIVKPNGTVKGCGCSKAIILGNVHTKVNIPDEWEWNECSVTQCERRKEAAKVA